MPFPEKKEPGELNSPGIPFSGIAAYRLDLNKTEQGRNPYFS